MMFYSFKTAGNKMGGKGAKMQILAKGLHFFSECQAKIDGAHFQPRFQDRSKPSSRLTTDTHFIPTHNEPCIAPFERLLRSVYPSRDTTVSVYKNPFDTAPAIILSQTGKLHSRPTILTSLPTQTSQNSQSWVSLVTPATSGRPLVLSVPHTARRGTQSPLTSLYMNNI